MQGRIARVVSLAGARAARRQRRQRSTAGNGGGTSCTSVGTELCDNFEGGVIDSHFGKCPSHRPASPSQSTRLDRTPAPTPAHPCCGRRTQLRPLPKPSPSPPGATPLPRIFAYLYPDLPQMQAVIPDWFHLRHRQERPRQRANRDGRDRRLQPESSAIRSFYGPPFFQFGPGLRLESPRYLDLLELHETARAPTPRIARSGSMTKS